MLDIFYKDGEWLDGSAVTQDLRGRGFAFGYGVFETMKFVAGQPCFFAEHCERLHRGVKAAGLEIVIDSAALREIARELFLRNEASDGVFKIVVWDELEGPCLAMFVRSVEDGDGPEEAKLLQSPVAKASKAFTSRHKSLNYMESVLQLAHARQEGYTECVFTNELNQLTECAVANLFFVRDGVLNTPSIDCGLLDGIVRSKIMDLARSIGVEVKQGRFSVEDLLSAQEAFLTSSGKGPRPAARFRSLDGREAIFESRSMVDRLLPLYRQLEEESVKSD
ncbi:aminotransferase class IV [Pelagicoccus sp. SDUM812003]|uniref:aminotransferase class IV n=1 Tax=Pelagicoccus sp. SDUM812003 TaxID=3041267 RepID=UPI00280D5193|nr:aminotransferase class IV [Pelagicoccus sp. SDUM812003]MDQ8201599.1 aminotransferase class IV [Pelagicoccus sp. SDUM812003]